MRRNSIAREGRTRFTYVIPGYVRRSRSGSYVEGFRINSGSLILKVKN